MDTPGKHGQGPAGPGEWCWTGRGSREEPWLPIQPFSSPQTRHKGHGALGLSAFRESQSWPQCSGQGERRQQTLCAPKIRFFHPVRERHSRVTPQRGQVSVTRFHSSSTRGLAQLGSHSTGKEMSYSQPGLACF